MNEDQIKRMVDRFLQWELPENFAPDAGISFKPEYNVEYNAGRGLPPARHKPSGTNLFDAGQADAMVRFMVNGMPDRRASTTAHDAIVDVASDIDKARREGWAQGMKDTMASIQAANKSKVPSATTAIEVLQIAPDDGSPGLWIDFQTSTDRDRIIALLTLKQGGK